LDTVALKLLLSKLAWGLSKRYNPGADWEETLMNLRPLHDRIVVKRLELEDGATGGIVIPDSAKEKPQHGEVIAVGKGKRLESGHVVPLGLKAGDRILFGKYSGADIKIEGGEYLIMREDEVLGLLGELPGESEGGERS
jgi:chaperonin GroES